MESIFSGRGSCPTISFPPLVNGNRRTRFPSATLSCIFSSVRRGMISFLPESFTFFFLLESPRSLVFAAETTSLFLPVSVTVSTLWVPSQCAGTPPMRRMTILYQRASPPLFRAPKFRNLRLRISCSGRFLFLAFPLSCSLWSDPSFSTPPVAMRNFCSDLKWMSLLSLLAMASSFPSLCCARTLPTERSFFYPKRNPYFLFPIGGPLPRTSENTTP